MSVQLVTVEDVRAFLQKPDPDTEQDRILSGLIDRASEAVITYTAREFAPIATSNQRLFYYCGNGVLDLTPYDLQVATTPTIVIDSVDGAGGTTLVATEYQLYPRPAKDGVYNWLRINPLSAYGPSRRFAEREVAITGDWGWPSVPDDVKHWTAVTVADWFRERVAAFGTRFNPETQQLEVPEDLPAAARSGLNRYRMRGR